MTEITMKTASAIIDAFLETYCEYDSSIDKKEKVDGGFFFQISVSQAPRDTSEIFGESFESLQTYTLLPDDESTSEKILGYFTPDEENHPDLRIVVNVVASSGDYSDDEYDAHLSGDFILTDVDNLAAVIERVTAEFRQEVANTLPRLLSMITECLEVSADAGMHKLSGNEDFKSVQRAYARALA